MLSAAVSIRNYRVVPGFLLGFSLPGSEGHHRACMCECASKGTKSLLQCALG